MQFALKKGRMLCAAALLALPSVALAQDNAANVAAETAVANGASATTDPALNDSMAADTATVDGFNTTAPMDNGAAEDLALANTVEPERDDDDFPWGLLGLLGLAGLLGRKKDGDIHVDARRDS